MNMQPALQRDSRRRRRKWALVWAAVAASLLCLLPLVAVAFPQSSRARIGDLSDKPGDLPGLGSLTWTGETIVNTDDELLVIWSGVPSDVGLRRVSFTQEIARATNSLTARWDYRSSPRIGFERDLPGRVFDVDDGLSLKADESDAYCVDNDNRYSRDRTSCHEWVFWARYSQFRVYMKLFRSDLSKDGFIALVEHMDTQANKEVKG